MLDAPARGRAQVQALRRALGAAPVRLPFLFAGPEAEGGIDAARARRSRDAAGLAA